MIKVERSSVMNFENAIRGARNPLNSWDRMDSVYDESGKYVLGENDLALAKKLARAGSDHRKFLRQIFVSVDITAPLYWWKEFDTYKIGTVANSTSTMHKIHSKEFSIDSDVYKTITFQAKKSGGTLPLVIEIYDSQNKNIGTKEIKVGDLSKSYQDFSISSDSYIRKIKF